MISYILIWGIHVSPLNRNTNCLSDPEFIYLNQNYVDFGTLKIMSRLGFIS